MTCKLISRFDLETLINSLFFLIFTASGKPFRRLKKMPIIKTYNCNILVSAKNSIDFYIR